MTHENMKEMDYTESEKNTNMTPCPKCGKMVITWELICPFCGSKIKEIDVEHIRFKEEDEFGDPVYQADVD